MQLVTPSAWYVVTTPLLEGVLSVVGDMRSLQVLPFGQTPMTMHCKQGDVQVKLSDVAYVHGGQFYLLSLHAVMPDSFARC